MTATRLRSAGSIALALSLLTFAVFFVNVLVGGPLAMKPWMSDLGEMLTLLLAVTFFVAGTLAREAQAGVGPDRPRADADAPSDAP